MTKEEMNKDVLLLQNYINKMIFEEDRREVEKLYKMAKAKINEIYKDKKALLKGQ